MNLATLVLILMLGLSAASCSRSGSSAKSSPTPDDPKTRAARAEERFHDFDIDLKGETRTAARNAVIEFVRTHLPSWTVRGISSQEFEDHIFSMDANIERKGHEAVVTFDVRKFFPDSGEPYWLAVPVNKFRLDRFRALTDAELKQKLEEAENQLETPEAEPSDNPEYP
jgi:hypothetical protein